MKTIEELMAFVDEHSQAVRLVVEEAQAILDSGQTGVHSDQARRNYIIANALLGLMEALLPPAEPATTKTA